MVDHVSKEKRSSIMRSIHGRNTSPEIAVRKALFKKGFRFRLHAKGLPGKPDLVLLKWNTVVFINGCFWHRHKNCAKASTPRSNIEFWEKKFLQNSARDKKNYSDLRRMGWKVLVVWQCAIIGKRKLEVGKLVKKIANFIEGSRNKQTISGKKIKFIQ